jgi:hypothetical protein
MKQEHIERYGALCETIETAIETALTDGIEVEHALVGSIASVTESALAFSPDDPSTDAFDPDDAIFMGFCAIIHVALQFLPAGAESMRPVKSAAQAALKHAADVEKTAAKRNHDRQHDFLMCQHIVSATSGDSDQSVGFIEKRCDDSNERYAVCDACATLDAEAWQAQSEHGSIMCEEHFNKAKAQLMTRGAAGSA